MPAAVFEPTIPASERPQTDALDCAATGTGKTLPLPDQTLAISYVNNADTTSEQELRQRQRTTVAGIRNLGIMVLTSLKGARL